MAMTLAVFSPILFLSRAVVLPDGSPKDEVTPPSYDHQSNLDNAGLERTTEQAWYPKAYIQYIAMKGTKCPTCIESAVGSTPTYTPIVLSARRSSRCLRSLNIASALRLSLPGLHEYTYPTT